MRIAELVEPTVEAMGYGLVRVLISPGRVPRLQVMVERQDQGPLSLDDCTEVSRALSAVLDVEDPIEGAYTLEVSSPGIDRPLTRRADFERFAGLEALVELAEPIEGQRRFKGRLLGVVGDEIRMSGLEREVRLPIGRIRRAKLVLNDELLAAEAMKARRAKE
ncbi:MAG TPA: ribosome maturation factor RimP [Alphaproteobacteria bacterium]|nr:ribosome maturation factor RimP [Alphaproteobacteria bacterium]